MARKGKKTQTTSHTNAYTEGEVVPESDQEESELLVLPDSRPRPQRKKMIMEVLIESKPPRKKRVYDGQRVEVVIESRRFRPVASSSKTVQRNPKAAKQRTKDAVQRLDKEKVRRESHADIQRTDEMPRNRLDTYQSSDRNTDKETLLPIIQKQSSNNPSPQIFRDITAANLTPPKYNLPNTSRTNILPLPLLSNPNAKTPTGPSHRLGKFPSIKYQIPKTLPVQDETPLSKRARVGIGLDKTEIHDREQSKKGKEKTTDHRQSSLPPSSPPSSIYAYDKSGINNTTLFEDAQESLDGPFEHSFSGQYDDYETHPWNIHASDQNNPTSSSGALPRPRSNVLHQIKYEPTPRRVTSTEKIIDETPNNVAPPKRTRRKVVVEQLDPALAPTADDPFGFFALEKKLKENRLLKTHQESDKVPLVDSTFDVQDDSPVTSSATRKRKRKQTESPGLNSTFLSFPSSTGHHGQSEEVPSEEEPDEASPPKVKKRQKPRPKKVDNSDPVALALSLEALLPRRPALRKRPNRKGKEKANVVSEDEATSEIEDASEPDEEPNQSRKRKSQVKLKPKKDVKVKSKEDGESEDDEEMALARAERIAYFEKLRKYKVASENVYVI